MKIARKGPNWDAIAELEKCASCNGSGHYDFANPRTGRVPKCAACGGTGKRLPPVQPMPSS